MYGVHRCIELNVIEAASRGRFHETGGIADVASFNR